jgi:glucose/arabinose dehydrogenase/cytochrome c551/c552
MARSSPIAFLLLLSACGDATPPAPPAQPAPTVVSLFDGVSLAGWSGDAEHWSVKDGCIVGRSTAERPLERSIYLFWDGEADDFDLTFEYRIVGGNSGLQYRSERLPDGEVAGYQADIEDGPNYTGILYESAGRGIMAERGARLRIAADGARSLGTPLGDPAQLMTSVRAGEWNRYRVLAVGATLVHEVNGVRMVEVVDEERGRARARGTFALQLHQGPPMEVRFRDMRMTRVSGARSVAAPTPAAAASAPATAGSARQESVAEWIWSPGAPAASERRHFLRPFDLPAPMRVAGGAIACDNRFTAWVDGVEPARGQDWAAPTAIPRGLELAAGRHVLAIECENEGGPAGVAARITLRGDGVEPIQLLTDATWRWGAAPPPGWPASRAIPDDWATTRSFGPIDGHSGPWGAAMAQQAATPASRYAAPPGFAVELIHSAVQGEGSWVSMTFGPRGELYVSPQQGRLLRLEFPGGHDAAPQVETLDVPAHSAQGLLHAHGALYANVQGGDAESGLHRMRDADGDGRFEEHAILVRYGPPGEHGPHGVVLGPDGMLYVVNGNHTVLPAPLAADSPFRAWQEDVLVERIWDPRGHAVGVMAPGGYVLRLDPDGKQVQMWFAGMRNAYDLAFAPNGELFSYDSDMEWDIGAPWYRAPRVVHVTPGGNSGWRSGSAKWPALQPDALPPTLDTGPASPTGTTFGGGKFPGAWREALYIADWAYGRITAVHLTPAGATYAATSETFVSGKPMNVADLEFGPDGAMWFITGGRGTQSGLYRVKWVGGVEPPPARGAFAAPAPELTLRRRLEAPDCPLAEAWPALGHADRFVRWAARLILERTPATQWRAQALALPEPLARAEAMLALARMDEAASGMDVARQIAAADLAREAAPLRWLRVRTAQLLWLRAPAERKAALRGVLLPAAARWFPLEDVLLDREIAALLTALDAEGLTAQMLARMRAAAFEEEKLAYAMLLRLRQDGWAPGERRDFLAALRHARSQPGGYSLEGFYAAIESHVLGSLPTAEAQELQASLPAPQPAAAYAPVEKRAFVRAWTMPAASAALEDADAPDLARGADLFARIGCVQCHRVNSIGGSVGPDLSAVGSRFGRRDLLEAILEPQKSTSDQYTLLQMPAGLADTLNAEELRDLIGYLESLPTR